MAVKSPVYSDDTGRELCRISDGLFSAKQRWDSLCQELAENYYPARADFTTELNLGDDFALDIMDSYPVQARAQLSDAIEAMLRQGEWFKVSTGDDDRDKRPGNARALGRLTMLLRNMLADPRTRWMQSMKEADPDYITFGQAVTSWHPSRDRTFGFQEAHHPRDCAFLLGPEHQTDTMYRKVKKTCREIMQLLDSGKWTGTPHPDIKKSAKDEPDRLIELRHCLMPMDDIYGSDSKMKRKLGRHNKWCSLYFDVEHETTFSSKGAPIFNYQVSRYRTLSTWPWGFSPVALQTLPDARMSQSLAAIFLEQGEKALDPPMIGAGDVFRNDINLWSGGFTMVDLADDRKLSDVMTVVDTSKNMAVGFEMRAEQRSLIAEGFLLNRLMLPNTKEMTAYESGIRLDEFRRAALPFFSPIEVEHHAPRLSGALDLAFSQSWIRPEELPEELHGQQISYRFQTPLNDAEGQKTVAAFQQAVANIGAMTDIDPTVKDLIDWSEASLDAVRGGGAPPTWFLDEEQIKERKAQNQKLKDAKAAGEAMQQGAAVAADVSSATMIAQQAGLTQAA
jgi:hypothetical protein